MRTTLNGLWANPQKGSQEIYYDTIKGAEHSLTMARTSPLGDSSEAGAWAGRT